MPSSLSRSTQFDTEQGKPKLFVAGACARPIVELARKADYSCAAADLFCDWDTQNKCSCNKINHLNELAELLAVYEFDELIIAGGLENFPKLVDRYCQHLPARNIKALVRCRDPFEVMQVVADSAVLRNHRIGFPSTVAQIPISASTTNWLSKIPSSAGGLGVSAVEPATHMPEVPSQVFQRRVEGRNMSGLFVADGSSCCLIGVTYQLNGDPSFGCREFKYCGSILATDLEESLTDRIRLIGQTMTQVFGLRGMFGVDMVCDCTMIWILEINPRITASAEIVVPAIPVNRNIITEHLVGLRGISSATVNWAFTNPTSKTPGKAIIYNRGRRAFTVSSQLFTELKSWHESGMSRSGIPSQVSDIPVKGTTIHSGCPIVTVKAQAQNKSETLQQLRALANDVFSIVD